MAHKDIYLPELQIRSGLFFFSSKNSTLITGGHSVVYRSIIMWISEVPLLAEMFRKLKLIGNFYNIYSCLPTFRKGTLLKQKVTFVLFLYKNLLCGSGLISFKWVPTCFHGETS